MFGQFVNRVDSYRAVEVVMQLNAWNADGRAHSISLLRVTSPVADTDRLLTRLSAAFINPHAVY